ncbi:MAG: cytochrome c biogenesis heme-transporting ATPase CcmA [Methylophilus sp.]|nr:cytochrome c biogenesis heme-transporting ATPase CcmA [Methylophilus sp.]
MSPTFSIHQLASIRGNRLLYKDIDFTLTAGNILYVQGANGTGKTTLLRTLCGLSKPLRGTIDWCGTSIYALNEDYARDLLYLGHQAGLQDDLTPLENLAFLLALAGEDMDDKQARQVLETLGLKQVLHLPVRFLSQGQKRRVSLARLWMQNALLWILDEPYAALDTEAIRLLELRIKQFSEEGGIVVMTSHQALAMQTGQLKHLSLDNSFEH